MDDKINLIFDCDGTLVDSYNAITDQIVRAFASLGLACEPEDVRRLCLFHTVGYCIEEIAKRNGLDVKMVEEAYGGTPENRALISLYPNCRQLLTNEAFRCFVYTHRGLSCHDIFGRLGIEDLFVEIVDASYGLEKKPSGQGVDYIACKYGLDRSRTYYVGDRIIDIECGVNAGVGTIFFNSSGLDIDCSKADYVVSDLGEIANIFKGR